jgi:D-alanine transaminase
MTFAIVYGELLERSKAKVDIEDRGFQFGDGIYEVIRVQRLFEAEIAGNFEK